jgi:hypothetical protein
MSDEALLSALTSLIGTQADMLFALVNFYGLVVIAVIGWIVNTGKDSAGISWFRIFLFNVGLCFFFAVVFGAFWFLYDKLTSTITAWAALAGESPSTGAELAGLAWFPPIEVLWGLWGFNVVILILATVLLRKGGYGRPETPIVE